MGQEGLSEQIRQHYRNDEKMVNALHELALEYCRQYMVVGGMPSSILLSPLNEDNTFMGAVAENLVAQALVANGHNTWYWRSDNTAKLDFVIQVGEQIIPIEVKKGTSTRAKSLSVFVDKYHPQLSLRISRKNFGMGNGIKSVPIYAIFCI